MRRQQIVPATFNGVMNNAVAGVALPKLHENGDWSESGAEYVGAAFAVAGLTDGHAGDPRSVDAPLGGGLLAFTRSNFRTNL